MAQRTMLMAGLLLLVKSQASDVAYRSTLQGFLSKYMPSGSDVPRSSMSDYDKFITPNLNHVKYGNGAEALSNHNNLAELGPSMGVSPFTTVDDKPVLHPSAQVQDSPAFTPARGKPSISAKDFRSPTIAHWEEKQAVQKLVINDSSNPIILSALGVGLLSLATMLGIRLRRRLQSASIIVSSGGLGPRMAMNTASVLGDNFMEMKSQDPNIDCNAAVLETRPAHKVKSNRVGWRQLSSQKACPLSPCHAGFKFENPFDDRPGATVGKLQIALANEDMAATKVVAECAAAFERDSSHQALPIFLADVATALARRSDAWLYAASSSERFDPGRVEKYDHETAYENLVNGEAVKFEVERTPSSEELERTAEGMRGMCVVSIVICLEGDETALFEDAAASEPRLRTALRDLATRCNVQDGDLVYNGEVLWTPSSADEALFKDDMLVDFPELLAL